MTEGQAHPDSSLRRNRTRRMLEGEVNETVYHNPRRCLDRRRFRYLWRHRSDRRVRISLSGASSSGDFCPLKTTSCPTRNSPSATRNDQPATKGRQPIQPGSADPEQPFANVRSWPTHRRFLASQVNQSQLALAEINAPEADSRPGVEISRPAARRQPKLRL
jgi:hypothetical protein